jgi:TIR domain
VSVLRCHFDGSLHIRKGEIVKIISAVPDSDPIRVSVIENLASGEIQRSRIEGVMMVKPPRTLHEPIRGKVKSSQVDQYNTYFEIEEIVEDANVDWTLQCDNVLRSLYDITKGITKRDAYSTTVAEKLRLDIKTTMDCFEYLESKRYVEIVRPKPTGVQYDLIHITSDGVGVVEKSHRDSQLRENRNLRLQEDIQVFICYAKEDSAKAMKLYGELERVHYLKPWIDKESLLPGQNWRVAIGNAIRDSRFFVALLSSNSVSKKGFVQKELKEALDVLDEYPESHVFLIPARLDDCRVSDSRLKQIQYVDLFPDWEKGFRKISDTIHNAISGSHT